MKILIIDDEKDIAESIQDILSMRGHEVVTAGNGAEGLIQLDRHAFDSSHLILLDLMMPVMNGERFLEALAERVPANRPRVIVMTASPGIPTSVLPVRILRKPVELEHLLKMIREPV